MLELKGIKKDYLAGENTVHALKGIDLRFRRNEFVSILGPSGCGKTTMLNIIGGLDQYTEGDLIINGRSTKDFKDRDWDTYRNHSIGFVFQSYNLIPHQTVLQNVELALTLSGVSKAERRKRAKKALEDVGLGNQLSKKPSEMSGGQMQRVAIARALVNNPDIILADEPTGALDTETSIQVMEILKEISRDRLIVMVTHNPELAEQYSSRIIRVLDGKLTDDSRPLTEEEYQRELQADKAENENGKKLKKPSMSFGTSFSLSLKNLFTKKGRTMLTSFAGSIGIIGIALVLSISQGFNTYINTIQEETLSSYPLTIQKTNTDLSALMETFMGSATSDSTHSNDAVYKKSAIYDMMDALNNMETSENDLKSFKSYIESKRKDSESDLHRAVNGVQYSYDLDMLIYTKNVDGTIIHSDTEELMQEMVLEHMGIDMQAMTNASTSMFGEDATSMMSMGMGGSSMNLWQELLPGDNGKPINDLLKKQYDVVYGSWPNSYDEIVLVLDENNELDDMTLYALGLEPKEDVDSIMEAAVNGKELQKDNKSWSYADICSMDFRTILNSDCYRYDESTGLYTDLRDTEAGLQYLYDNGLKLKVTGIIRPNEDTTAPMLSGSIAYTSDLTKYIIEHSKESDAITAQKDSKNTDIFTGLPFKDTSGSTSDADKQTAFLEYLNELDDGGKAQAYVQIMSIPTEEQLNDSVQQAMQGMSRSDMEAAMLQGMTQQMSMSESDVQSYLESMSDDEITDTFTQMMQQQVKAQYAQQVQQQMAAMQPAELVGALNQLLPTLTTEQCANYYDEMMQFSDSTYEDNLKALGDIDLDDPASINLYAATFEDKDVIEDAIADYNEGKDEMAQIQYTDYVGLMMSSVTKIINTITYVLIAFVAISLIVSSIMIGVITLISVQERTKEIGILRAIGASKRDVSSMFNAETIIIGFASGLLGIVVTYLLCIPINLLVHHLTGIQNLSAVLPVPAAIILIAISVLLTLIAGFIPSKSAAKKDPVVALRSE
ncbi:ABC transporter ATP-binding protein/permease [uncultured Ruminococcus sp.]|uniref:ABC transporter ATP-binding protein/permease n=1 Tax=uncultured Ruminococcus sp. TaxID=165186 RepID=UPI00266F6251|nr:ABC transporter ATP-binding protein/permease [uncultured Ruminococcus sp.]